VAGDLLILAIPLIGRGLTSAPATASAAAIVRVQAPPGPENPFP